MVCCVGKACNEPIAGIVTLIFIAIATGGITRLIDKLAELLKSYMCFPQRKVGTLTVWTGISKS